MKAFFSKIWTWILAHKIIAIVVASVLVVGTTCAIVLPIALHEHSYATEWSSDADNHWHDATCKHEEEKSDLAAHTYTNACDTTCDVCGYTRTVGAHTYDNACDVSCNVCGAERTVGAHVYDNACDTSCNVCGATREITHAHGTTLTAGDTTHYYACSVCGDKKDEAAHVFDKTVASSEYLKAAATATTKAQYYKSCVCGAKSATEYFETDKTAGTLANIQDLSKTYDKVELANPTYETNSDGAVTIEWYQGDTKLNAKPVNAGTYKVKVIIAESATYTGISAEKEFTIAKKVLSNLSVDLTYAGTNYFEVPLGEENGIAASDVADIIKVCITFANKNVGAAVTGAGLDADDGDNYTNYELDLATCTASIVPKTLNYLEITKVYDGEGVLAYALGTEHGVVAGDEVLFYCDEEPDYIVGTYGLIPENDPTTIDDAGADDRALLAGADKANYKFAERIEGKYKLCATITVTKRPVWAENVEFTYDGYTNWTGEESPNQIVFQNMANGETMDSSFVKWTFDSKNVGATLTSVTFVDEDDGRSNYEIDFSKCTASIIPRVIDNLTYAFEYNGMEYHQAVISKNEHSGIVGDDQISLEVCFATPNVGAALDTSEETGFEPSFVEENYVLGTTYEFSIIPREIWITDTQFYYSGYTSFGDDETANGCNIQNAATDGERGYMEGFFHFTFDDADVGSELIDVELYGLEESFMNNYAVNVSKCEAEIIPMELTNLKLQITENTFEEGWAYLNATNGVVHGDKVYITWTESGHSNTAGWIERGSDLVAPHTGTAIQGQAQVTLAGADVNNYTLVIKNNTYGRMEYSEKCKPDIYGYCACGEEHIAYTFNSADTVATVPVGPAGGKTWEGGIYALNTTTPGYWNIQPNDNYCTVTVYNHHGTKLTVKNFEFYAATAGTYYVHISKNSEPVSGDVITFRFVYALEDNGGSYDSLKVNCVNGSYYYFKVDADARWGASLNVMDGNGDIIDIDLAKYTVKIYDQDFNEMTDVIYDGTDIYKEFDDDFTVTDKLIYIQITVHVDTELCISVF